MDISDAQLLDEADPMHPAHAQQIVDDDTMLGNDHLYDDAVWAVRHMDANTADSSDDDDPPLDGTFSTWDQ